MNKVYQNSLGLYLKLTFQKKCFLENQQRGRFADSTFRKRAFPFYKTTGEEFRKSVKLIKIPYSLYNCRENPPPSGLKNSVVPSKNCQNSVFLDKFFPNSAVSQTLMAPTLSYGPINRID